MAPRTAVDAEGSSDLVSMLAKLLRPVMGSYGPQT